MAGSPPRQTQEDRLREIESILDPFQRLVAIMRHLRDPVQGCPWDIEQTFATIAPHTLEEAYEVVDAIESQDSAALRDELGDLLLQVIFHSQMADDQQLFSINEVVEGICNKMLRRHPHVFSDAVVASAEEQVTAWEQIKQQERAEKTSHFPSALEGITAALPAMTRAVKLQKRAAHVGFDWTEARQVIGKVEEEVAELKAEFLPESPHPERLTDEIGDVLFTVVNLARKANVDPEAALRHANRKFEQRFRAMEQASLCQGVDFSSLTLEEMESLWQQVKRDLAVEAAS